MYIFTERGKVDQQKLWLTNNSTGTLYHFWCFIFL
jgi:hypothetical protein